MATENDLRQNELTALMQKACQIMMANQEEPLTLTDLAARMHMSQFHFQRTFKACLGLTPKQFQRALKMQSFKELLHTTNNITEAIYAAGFGSSSRVYEHIHEHLAMTPKQYRTHGRGLTISYATQHTRLGLLMIAATDSGICFIQFGDTDNALKDSLHKEFKDAHIIPMQESQAPLFAEWMQALSAYLEQGHILKHLPLDLRGTLFQIRVWRYLQSIPHGEVRSYRAVAEALQQPNAARAVARACATNTIALAIPCHRVIRGSGDLAGYRFGLARKRALLEQEQAHPKKPQK